MTPTPNFNGFEWVVVNSSGGKDSQVALARTVGVAEEQGFPLNRVVVSHQDLGRMEWAGTKELVFEQAAHYGLRVEVTQYRNKDGETPDLLDYVRKRGMWPSNSQRYCTSDFKRGPGGRVLTKLARESSGDILQVFGFRAQESPARSKKNPYTLNRRASTKSREVWDWLPIHELTEEQVWKKIREEGVRHHPAYDLGMPRLSCVFCIFAPRDALLTAGIANPELLQEYVDLEEEIDHTFQNGKSLRDIQKAIEAGELPTGCSGEWNM